MQKQSSKKSTSLSAARRAKTSPSRADSAASTATEARSFSNKCASPANSARNTSSGKTCPECSRQTAGATSQKSSPNSRAGQSSRRNSAVSAVSAREAKATSAFFIGYSIRGFSESPNAAAESTLSRVLEVSAAPKYFLSPTACAGILRRAQRRGKTLPPLLIRALASTIARATPQHCESAAKQRAAEALS